jgi:HAMP domain-containing protein
MISITSILSYKWYKEIYEGFKTKLKSAVVSCAGMVAPEDLVLVDQDHIHFRTSDPQTKMLYEDFSRIKNDLDITNLYVVFIQPDKTSISFLEAKDLFNVKKINVDKIENPSNFSSKKEALIKSYFITKDVLFTPAYKNKDSLKKVITAYAPIKNNDQNVIAYMAADMNLDIINKKLSEGLSIIILASGIIITSMLILLFVIANRITQPVQRLNNSALFLAAGHYGNKIELKGPKEIEELSNTINILSDCLYENINRLKENSIIRERMYGEHECSMLLQNHMLKKVIDENQSDSIAVDSINIYSPKPRGFLLDFPKTETDSFLQLRFIEAKDNGFDGMYELLTNYKLFKENQSKLNKNFPTLSLNLDKDLNIINLYSNKFTYPYIFSIEKKTFIDFTKNAASLMPGDLIFVFNKGLINLLQTNQNVQNVLFKVLKFFSNDGLETIVSMLKKELLFATKGKNIHEDIHLLCFQRLF